MLILFAQFLRRGNPGERTVFVADVIYLGITLERLSGPRVSTSSPNPLLMGNRTGRREVDPVLLTEESNNLRLKDTPVRYDTVSH